MIKKIKNIGDLHSYFMWKRYTKVFFTKSVLIFLKLYIYTHMSVSGNGTFKCLRLVSCEDLRMEFYVYANHLGGDYTKGPNTFEDPNAIVASTMIYQLMLNKNYEDASKSDAQKAKEYDNDVHHELVDFIRRLALCLRMIDKPTQLGVIEHRFNRIIDSSIDAFLNSKYSNRRRWELIIDINLNSDSAVPDFIADLHRYLTNDEHNMTKYIDDLSVAMNLDIRTIHDTFKEKLDNQEKLIKSALHNAKNDKNKTAFRYVLSDIVKQAIKNVIRKINHDGYTTLTIKPHVDALTGLTKEIAANVEKMLNARPGIDTNNLHDIVIQALTEYNGQLKETKKKLEDYQKLDRDHTEEIGQLRARVLQMEQGIQDLNDEIKHYQDKKKKLEEELGKYHRGLTDSQGEIATLRNDIEDTKVRLGATLDQLQLAQREITRITQEKQNLEDDNEQLRQQIAAAAPVATGGHRNPLENLWESIIGNWNSEAMSHECRQYLRTIFIPMYRINEVWKPISFDEAHAGHLSSDKVRLNLRKVTPNTSLTIIEHTIPYIPVDYVNGLWYTGRNGDQIRLEKGTFGPDILHKIFHETYVKGDDNIYVSDCNSDTHTYMYFPEGKIDPQSRFRINAPIFGRNLIYATRAEMQQPRNTVSIHDLFVDMVDGQKYHREDGTGLLYREINGNKVYYGKDPAGNIGEGTDRAMSRRNMSTGLDLGPKKTEAIYTCLLSGDSASLKKCLAFFNNAETFNVAQAEIEEMEPGVALKILETFGWTFAREYNPDLKVHLQVPISFDVWRTQVLPVKIDPNVANVLLKNEKLINYLKGIVAFIRANPAITNPNMNPAQLDDGIPPWVDQLGIKRFRMPDGDPNKVGVVDIVRMLTTTPVVAQPLLVPHKRGIAGFGVVPPFIGQFGGRHSFSDLTTFVKRSRDGTISSPDVLNAIFQRLKHAMREQKRILDPNDEKRIMDALAEIKDLELKVIKLLTYMKTFIDLRNAQIMNHGLGTRDLPISISQIMSRGNNYEDYNDYLEQSISEIADCIERNQTSLMLTREQLRENVLLGMAQLVETGSTQMFQEV